MFHGEKVDTQLHLNVNGKIIPENEQVIFLGVTNDSNLNPNLRIKQNCCKVNQKTSALSRLRECISEKSQIITEHGYNIKIPILSFNMVFL